MHIHFPNHDSAHRTLIRRDATLLTAELPPCISPCLLPSYIVPYLISVYKSTGDIPCNTMLNVAHKQASICSRYNDIRARTLASQLDSDYLRQSTSIKGPVQARVMAIRFPQIHFPVSNRRLENATALRVALASGVRDIGRENHRSFFAAPIGSR